MDDAQVTSRLRPVLGSRLKDFEIRILDNSYPTSVSFLVTSDEFEGVSRWKRIEMMTDVVGEAFGLPLQVGIGGLALTPKEADELHPWEDDESSDFDFADSPDSATRPLDQG